GCLCFYQDSQSSVTRRASRDNARVLRTRAPIPSELPRACHRSVARCEIRAMLPETLNPSGRSRRALHAQLYFFRDWCSRPEKLLLREEDRIGLFDKCNRGTRFSLITPV